MNNITLKIEMMAKNTNSYIIAVLDFCEENQIAEYEDILEVLDPILVSKIRQEFIDKNYVPELKNKNTIFDFLGE